MKPRSDSRLFKPAPEQQAQLYDWIHKLGYAKAREFAAVPPPDKIHLNSLCRFVARYSEMQKEREFFEILRCASGELHRQALRAAETMAHRKAFEIATSPQQDLNHFRLLSRWIMKCKDQQQNEARPGFGLRPPHRSHKRNVKGTTIVKNSPEEKASRRWRHGRGHLGPHVKIRCKQLIVRLIEARVFPAVISAALSLAMPLKLKTDAQRSAATLVLFEHQCSIITES
jgi:hypothetical protein